MKTQADFSGGTAIYKNLLQFENNPLVLKFGDGDVVEIKQCLSFPGLVNSHDHLDFDLFPLLKNKIYDDYKSWGADIHSVNKEAIDRVLAVPLLLRLRWGVLKNILNGFTEIVHHGAAHNLIRQIPYPVFLDYRYLHAIATEPLWRVKMNLPDFKDIMIHVGEGVGSDVAGEVQSLLNWNLLGKKIIGIHAIQMTPAQSARFKAIIWCPESNINLYGVTAPVDKLKQHTSILFGTDSTVSASANHWQHLRNARTSGLMNEMEIFDSLTETARNTFKMKRKNSLVIANKRGHSWDGFFSIEPADILFVSNDDEVLLIDNSIKDMRQDEFELISVGGQTKWVSRTFSDEIIGSLEKYAVPLPLNVTGA